MRRATVNVLTVTIVAFMLGVAFFAPPAQVDRPVTADIGFSLGVGPIYVETFDLARQFMTEPFESAVIVFTDLSGFRITTQDALSINVPVTTLEDLVRQRGKTPADIAIIIHNHLLIGGFSDGDKAVARYFQARGFRGYFAIYYPHNGKVRLLGADR